VNHFRHSLHRRLDIDASVRRDALDRAFHGAPLDHDPAARGRPFRPCRGSRSRRAVDHDEGAAEERATELRARYGFRSPDAIHLATAIDAGAIVFITGDASLTRCADVAVDVLTPRAFPQPT
jgi:hypothetical protein